MAASTIANTEMLDNLATALQMLTMPRVAKLVGLVTNRLNHGTDIESEDVVQWALEEFDGLEAEFRRQLVDREWSCVRVGPVEGAPDFLAREYA